MSVRHRALTGAGHRIDPGNAVVPILKEIEHGFLAVVGTGFYVSRYGLFLTAAHVLETLADWTAGEICTAFVLHLAGDKEVHFRVVKRVSLLKHVDLGIGQADNYVEQFPRMALMNLRVALTTEIPPPGTPLVTYAYPENSILDFTQRERNFTIHADYFDGKLLRFVEKSENPFLPYPHFETTIEIRSGASGGPVFAQFADGTRRVIGVNCRGWDFRGSEHEGQNLSLIVPISALLPLRVELAQVPLNSWEFAQIPVNTLGHLFTVEELAGFGHLLFKPPL